MRTKNTALKVLYYIAIALLCVVFIYPFWWMVVNSFNDINDIFGPPTLLPRSFQWENYVEIFRVQPFARQYMNTVLVAVAGTVGNLLVSSLSGYAFARLRFPGRSALFILLLTALMMPIEVTIVPMYFMMRGMGLSDSLFPLIFSPMFCSQGAFSAFMLRQHYVTVPKEYEEAARLDGLSPMGIYFRIMLPIAVPVLSSCAILAFLSVWNMYLEPLVFISSVAKYTLPLALANFNDSYGLPQWNLQLAATTLSVIPVMIVYLIFQEKISNAMVNSGLK